MKTIKRSGMRTTIAGLALAATGIVATPATAQSADISYELGVEYLALEFFASQGAAASDSEPDDTFPDYGTNGVARYTLGAELGNGIGARLRYFEFDETETLLGIDRNVNFRMLDADAYFPLFSDGGRQVEVFAGFRNGFIHLDGSDFGSNDTYEFEGTGITVGSNFQMPVSDSFSFLFGGRYSLLQGDVNFAPVSTVTLDNVLLHSFEVSLGAEYTHAFAAFDLAARAGWEMQYYGTDTYFPFAIDPETVGDVGLGGLTAELALTF